MPPKTVTSGSPDKGSSILGALRQVSDQEPPIRRRNDVSVEVSRIEKIGATLYAALLGIAALYGAELTYEIPVRMIELVNASGPGLRDLAGIIYYAITDALTAERDQAQAVAFGLSALAASMYTMYNTNRTLVSTEFQSGQTNTITKMESGFSAKSRVNANASGSYTIPGFANASANAGTRNEADASFRDTTTLARTGARSKFSTSQGFGANASDVSNATKWAIDATGNLVRAEKTLAANILLAGLGVFYGWMPVILSFLWSMYRLIQLDTRFTIGLRRFIKLYLTFFGTLATGNMLSLTNDNFYGVQPMLALSGPETLETHLRTGGNAEITVDRPDLAIHKQLLQLVGWQYPDTITVRESNQNTGPTSPWTQQFETLLQGVRSRVQPESEENTVNDQQPEQSTTITSVLDTYGSATMKISGNDIGANTNLFRSFFLGECAMKLTKSELREHIPAQRIFKEIMTNSTFNATKQTMLENIRGIFKQPSQESLYKRMSESTTGSIQGDPTITYNVTSKSFELQLNVNTSETPVVIPVTTTDVFKEYVNIRSITAKKQKLVLELNDTQQPATQTAFPLTAYEVTSEKQYWKPKILPPGLNITIKGKEQITAALNTTKEWVYAHKIQLRFNENSVRYWVGDTPDSSTMQEAIYGGRKSIADHGLFSPTQERIIYVNGLVIPDGKTIRIVDIGGTRYWAFKSNTENGNSLTNQLDIGNLRFSRDEITDHLSPVYASGESVVRMTNLDTVDGQPVALAPQTMVLGGQNQTHQPQQVIDAVPALNSALTNFPDPDEREWTIMRNCINTRFLPRPIIQNSYSYLHPAPRVTVMRISIDSSLMPIPIQIPFANHSFPPPEAADYEREWEASRQNPEFLNQNEAYQMINGPEPDQAFLAQVNANSTTATSMVGQNGSFFSTLVSMDYSHITGWNNIFPIRNATSEDSDLQFPATMWRQEARSIVVSPNETTAFSFQITDSDTTTTYLTQADGRPIPIEDVTVDEAEFFDEETFNRLFPLRWRNQRLWFTAVCIAAGLGLRAGNPPAGKTFKYARVLGFSDSSGEGTDASALDWARDNPDAVIDNANVTLCDALERAMQLMKAKVSRRVNGRFSWEPDFNVGSDSDLGGYRYDRYYYLKPLVDFGSYISQPRVTIQRVREMVRSIVIQPPRTISTKAEDIANEMVKMLKSYFVASMVESLDMQLLHKAGRQVSGLDEADKVFQSGPRSVPKCPLSGQEMNCSFPFVTFTTKTQTGIQVKWYSLAAILNMGDRPENPLQIRLSEGVLDTKASSANNIYVATANVDQMIKLLYGEQKDANVTTNVDQESFDMVVRSAKRNFVPKRWIEIQYNAQCEQTSNENIGVDIQCKLSKRYLTPYERTVRVNEVGTQNITDTIRDIFNCHIIARTKHLELELKEKLKNDMIRFISELYTELHGATGYSEEYSLSAVMYLCTRYDKKFNALFSDENDYSMCFVALMLFWCGIITTEDTDIHGDINLIETLLHYDDELEASILRLLDLYSLDDVHVWANDNRLVIPDSTNVDEIKMDLMKEKTGLDVSNDILDLRLSEGRPGAIRKDEYFFGSFEERIFAEMERIKSILEEKGENIKTLPLEEQGGCLPLYKSESRQQPQGKMDNTDSSMLCGPPCEICGYGLYTQASRTRELIVTRNPRKGGSYETDPCLGGNLTRNTVCLACEIIGNLEFSTTNSGDAGILECYNQAQLDQGRTLRFKGARLTDDEQDRAIQFIAKHLTKKRLRGLLTPQFSLNVPGLDAAKLEDILKESQLMGIVCMRQHNTDGTVYRYAESCIPTLERYMSTKRISIPNPQ